MYPLDARPERSHRSAAPSTAGSFAVRVDRLRRARSGILFTLYGVLASTAVIIGLSVLSVAPTTVATGRLALAVGPILLAVVIAAFTYLLVRGTTRDASSATRVHSSVATESSLWSALNASRALDEAKGEHTRIAALGLLGSIGLQTPEAGGVCGRILEAAVRDAARQREGSPSEVLAGLNSLSELSRRGHLRFQVDLQHCDLSRLDLRGLWLTGADLSGSNLADSDLSGARLDESILQGVQLADCHAVGASFKNATLTEANLARGFFVASDFGGALLARTNLTGATLVDASFSDALLSEANLTGADLRGADLQRALLVNANLSSTDLYSANLFEAAIDEAQADEIRSAGEGRNVRDSVTVLDEADLTTWVRHVRTLEWPSRD